MKLRRRSHPCCAETLENRTLLATVFWDGGAGDSSWHSPANWSGDSLPGPADDVILSVPGTAIIRFTTGTATVRTVRSREDLRLLGGTLIVGVNARVETGLLTVAGGALRAQSKLEVLEEGGLRLTSGRIEGAGKVQVWGSMIWSGGVFAGTGVAFIEDNAALTIDGADVRLERRLVNRGDLLWTGQTWTIASGYFRNDPSGIVTITHDSGTTSTPRIASLDGAARFYLHGRLDVNEPPPGVSISAPRRAEIAVRTVTHAGSNIRAQNGIVHFSRGGVHSGRFDLELSAGVAFSGSTWYTSSAAFVTAVNNCEVRFEGGTHTIKRARDWGAIAVSLNDGAFVHFAEHQQMDDLFLWHGTVAGPADIIVRDSFFWNGGSMLGTGRTIVEPGSMVGISTLVAPAGPTLRLTRDLELHGYTPMFDAQLVLIGAQLVLGPQSEVMWRTERVYGAGDARIVNFGDLDMVWTVAMTGVRVENHGSWEIGGGFVQIAGSGTMVQDSGTLVLSLDGRLKVVGDYVRSGGVVESLFVRFQSSGMHCGRIVVTGRASLAGSVRAVFAINLEGRPAIGDDFVLVWAGQRVGEFGSMTHTTLPGIGARLQFDPRSASLVIEPE